MNARPIGSLPYSLRTISSCSPPAEQAETPRQRTVRAAEHGAVTWGAFLIAGAMPLVPFLFAGVLPNPFAFSVGAAGLTLLTVGASRTFVTGHSAVRGGLEMLFVGALAGCVAYIAGCAVQHIGGWGQ